LFALSLLSPLYWCASAEVSTEDTHAHMQACTHALTHSLTHACIHVHTPRLHIVYILQYFVSMYYILLLPLASFSPDKCCKVKSKDGDQVELTRVTTQGVDKQNNAYTNVASSKISGDVIGEEPA